MTTDETNSRAGRPRSGLVLLIVAWTLVGAPLAWGVYMSLLGALKLFTS